jgi:outer membrane protein TolC
MRSIFTVPRSTRLVLTILGIVASTQAVSAQEKVVPAPTPFSLDQCIDLAMQRQPALAAARASLAAAEDGRQALHNLPLFARVATRELPIRQQQACLGVSIASATLAQAEWDARYAVTRNYFSVIYVRMQQALLTKVIDDLKRGRKRAKELVDAGDPDVKVTKSDLDLFDINLDLVLVRQVEATVGAEKALAALREAIGLGAAGGFDVALGTLPPLVMSLDRDALIHLAQANRGEVAQASLAHSVTDLEVAAQQRKHFGLKVETFASASDIHVQPIPQGVANGEYRPGAIGIEMPPTLVGRHTDRVARAADLSGRAGAVVDKTLNLVALEAENSYLKWLEARDRFQRFASALPRARDVEKRLYDRLDLGKATGTEYLQAATLQDQIQAQYNEALYFHALALAALERITAGGYRIYPAKLP